MMTLVSALKSLILSCALVAGPTTGSPAHDLPFDSYNPNSHKHSFDIGFFRGLVTLNVATEYVIEESGLMYVSVLNFSPYNIECSFAPSREYIVFGANSTVRIIYPYPVDISKDMLCKRFDPQNPLSSPGLQI